MAVAGEYSASSGGRAGEDAVAHLVDGAARGLEPLEPPARACLLACADVLVGPRGGRPGGDQVEGRVVVAL